MEVKSRKGLGGPKTPEGRARSALNAVKHGLTAASPVALHRETEAEWQAHREGILQSLAPVGRLEQVLAEKIALTLWRQARVAAYETLRTNQRLQRAPADIEGSLWPHATPEDAERRLQAALVDRLLLDEAELRKLQRYEGHLGRELSRLFKHFHHLQSLRGSQDSAPAAPAVDPSPGIGPHVENDETNSPPVLVPPASSAPGDRDAVLPTELSRSLRLRKERGPGPGMLCPPSAGAESRPRTGPAPPYQG